MKYLLLLVIVYAHSTVFAIEEKVILKSIKNLGRELKKELQAGMKKSPSEALKVCNIEAPKIEGRYKSERLKIGRVSVKNRNPNNSPKDWMLKYIDQFQNKKIEKSHLFVKINDQKKGFLKPIVTIPMCLKCHGSSIDTKLNTEILKLYPDDKARGFKVGDIRGYFWAEYNID